MTKQEALAKIKELEEYINELEEYINELDKPKGISSGRVPMDEWYFYIGYDGPCVKAKERGECYDKAFHEAGNYYQTGEQAIAHEKKIRVYRKLLKYADELNEGWVPDWSDDGEWKYSLKYNREDDYIFTASTENNTGLSPLFKAELSALKAWSMLTEEEEEIFKS